MLLDERVRRRRDLRALTARWITLASAAAALLPTETAAQGRISGSVVDSDGEPLAYALIRLRDGAEVASTDEQGRFVLDGVQVGVTWIAGVRPGCTAAVDSVSVRQGAS